MMLPAAAGEHPGVLCDSLCPDPFLLEQQHVEQLLAACALHGTNGNVRPHAGDPAPRAEQHGPFGVGIGNSIISEAELYKFIIEAESCPPLNVPHKQFM
jgi:hypothetical protein